MKLTKSTILDIVPCTFWLVKLRPKDYSAYRNEIIYIISVDEYKQRGVTFQLISDEDLPVYNWDEVYHMSFIEKINVGDCV